MGVIDLKRSCRRGDLPHSVFCIFHAMNYQSLAKLEKKLAGYPQKARDFLFAVVSDPWQVKRDN
ncbi:hypothetical protein, partial [Duodenibacillus massiliensis]